MSDNNKEAIQHINKALELIEALKNAKTAINTNNNQKSAFIIPAFLQIQAG